MEVQIMYTFLALSVAFLIMVMYLTEVIKQEKTSWKKQLLFSLWGICVVATLGHLYPIIMYLLA